MHAVTGISFSLLMYLTVFFGIFAILLPYIQVWEKPSRHYPIPDITKIDYSSMIDPILADPEYPKINGVTIILPGTREDPALMISARFTENIIFNPNTGKRVENERDASQLAWFLNSMHYGRPFKRFGYTVFGLMATAGMFLIIGGVIQIFKIKYRNSGRNAQSKFSKWHRRIFTWLFPPFIIVTLTGALMTIGYTGSAPMAWLASKGTTHEVWKLTGPVLYPDPSRIEKKNDSVPMLTMNELIRIAREVNPAINYQRIWLDNWGDSSARAKLEGYNPSRPFLNGISNKPSVTLSGVDGRVIERRDVLDKHWSGLFFDSIYFLHLLFGVGTFIRLLFATIMSVSALALGFGVLIWLEKKARKFPKGVPFYHWMGKFSLAVMVGVIPATGLMFALQWILPFDMPDRFLWHKGIFGIFWIGTLTWSFYRINSYQAAREFMILGGILFLISPFIHFLGSGFFPLALWNNHMTNILGVDIGLFVFGLLLLYTGYKLPQEREEVQAFWTKRL